MSIDERYLKNIGPLAREECELLAQKRVCVIGSGGLGGYVIEYLLRMGVGFIRAVDGDTFETSNLNRQLLANENNIGTSKAVEAQKRANQVNSDTQLEVVPYYIDEDNVKDIIGDCDIVIDALDSIVTRLTLAKACEVAQKVLVHGAVRGWSVQVAVLLPNSGGMEKIYSTGGESNNNPVLSFVPAYAAAIQVAEAVKILCGRQSDLSGKLLCADLQTCEQMILDL